MKENSTTTVSGTAFYASVHTPNQMSDKFEITLSVSGEEAARLEDLGLSPAADRDGNLKHFEGTNKAFKFTKATHRKDGTPMSVNVVDSQGNDTDVLIGNGSTVEVLVFIDHTTNPKTKKPAIVGRLNAVQIIDLVPFERKPVFTKKAGGFVASASTGSHASEEDEGVI